MNFCSYQADATDQCRPRGFRATKRGDKNKKHGYVQRSETVTICFIVQIQSQFRTGWWFQIFFIFTPIWGRFPI